MIFKYMVKTFTKNIKKGLNMKAIEVEIYGNNSEFESGEFDVYVNDTNYECVESYTINGLDKAKKKAEQLSKKYNVPIKENI